MRKDSRLFSAIPKFYINSITYYMPVFKLSNGGSSLCFKNWTLPKKIPALLTVEWRFSVYFLRYKRYNRTMKKVLEVEGMCCKRCGERAERKLRLLNGVTGARANVKKGFVFVESELCDEDLSACLAEAGFTVTRIRPRKGLFG